MKNMYVIFAACFVAIMMAAPMTADAAGTVKGTISTKSGGAPVKINITKDKGVCGKTPLFKENLIVSKSGGVANAVVEILEAGEAKAVKVHIAQNGCRFTPHVVLMPASSSLEINNRDGLTHNFHSYGFENDPVNFSQPGDMKVKVVKGENFESAEAVQLRCDIHEWMEAWAYVTESGAAAITDANGNFTITGVKPGAYKVKIWHEALGEVEQDITVKDGDNVLNHTLTKK